MVSIDDNVNILSICSKTIHIKLPHYAPNFGKVEGAYCFRLVCVCVGPLQNKLRYSFEIAYIPLCGVMPLLKGHNEIL